MMRARWTSRIVLKVYGSRELHLRKHRYGRRRAWWKPRLGVDETRKDIVAVEVTPSRIHDSGMLPRLLSQILGWIDQAFGDGAYDTRACFQSILDREAVVYPPLSGKRTPTFHTTLTEMSDRQQVLLDALGPHLLLKAKVMQKSENKNKCEPNWSCFGYPTVLL